MKTKTKEEIIYKMRQEMPFIISDRVVPYIEEAMQTFSDQQGKAREELIKECLEAFEKIAEAKGAYSMDRLQHASNTIRDMVEIAKNKITELKNR